MAEAPDLQFIYQHRAADYERLVSREDRDGNILPALRGIARLEGADIVELGAGTGRLTRLLAPRAARLLALDSSRHMLEFAARAAAVRPRGRWQPVVADHRHLPVGDGAAHIVVAGWSLCYTVVGYEDRWARELGAALAEVWRVLRPGGTAIIVETLGTGYKEPHPPKDLAPYFAYLEEIGFRATWIRTDYEFASAHEAERLTRFFFGGPLAERMRRERLTVLPECTGIWWRGR